MQHPTINIAVRAARRAGNIIVRGLEQRESLHIERKAHNDFVSEIDRRAEEAIIEVLRTSFPDHGIVAEESGYQQGASGSQWIIDPLDGTTNFLHGHPQFAVSIALQREQTLEHAVIYDPLRDELFTASRGRGAFLNDRRIRVSNVSKFDEALLGTGFPFRDEGILEIYLQTFRALFPRVSGVRRAGSAALDLAYVAAGRLDGFWEFYLKPWDIAAGALLIKEAGGLITDMRGSDDYLECGHVVTGTAKVFKELLKILHDCNSGQVK
jgi:myo-inositol-1(or 4)-monophosphatase